MSSYIYELPTTGAASFSDFCYDQTASYVTEVAETTETRANLRVALKEYKRTDDDEKDYLSLVKASVASIHRQLRRSLQSSNVHLDPR